MRREHTGGFRLRVSQRSCRLASPCLNHETVIVACVNMESRRAARGCVDAAPCTLPRDTRQPGSIAEGEDAGLGRTNVHVAHPLYSVTGGVVEFAEGGRAVVVAPHLLEQVGQNLRAPCLSGADVSIICVRVISPFPRRINVPVGPPPRALEEVVRVAGGRKRRFGVSESANFIRQ